jgi:molybdopterin molybdotransferase
MVKFEEAYDIVIKSIQQLPIDRVRLENSLGRVLAEDVYSDMNMPPFDKSAMDGYACRYEDIANELEVVEIIPAGKMPERTIGSNQCAKIMTGAMIPEGADCVIMVEDTEEIDPNKIRYTREVKELNVCALNFKEKRQLNICYLGEDIKEGDIVVEKGTFIRPQDVATMASVGYVNVLVSRMPKVAVIPTGNEIVEPDIKPSVSEIRNSNGSQLLAQLKKCWNRCLLCRNCKGY